MIKLKCPVCKETLLSTTNDGEPQVYAERLYCPKCKKSGEYELWKSLIDTYEKLDIAINALKDIENCEVGSSFTAHATIKYISMKGEK